MKSRRSVVDPRQGGVDLVMSLRCRSRARSSIARTVSDEARSARSDGFVSPCNAAGFLRSRRECSLHLRVWREVLLLALVHERLTVRGFVAVLDNADYAHDFRFPYPTWRPYSGVDVYGTMTSRAAGNHRRGYLTPAAFVNGAGPSAYRESFLQPLSAHSTASPLRRGNHVHGSPRRRSRRRPPRPKARVRPSSPPTRRAAACRVLSTFSR